MKAAIRRSTIEDFGVIWPFYFSSLTKSMKKKSGHKPIIPLEMQVRLQFALKQSIQDDYFYIAAYGRVIVASMLLTPERNIKYLSMDREAVSDVDGFIHSEATAQESDWNYIDELLDSIEAEAIDDPRVRHTYVALEGAKPKEWWEERGYNKIGVECRSCTLSGGICNGVPMYRKKMQK